MAKDWEKLAGEKGERVTSSKFGRMMKLGSVGAGVAASSLAGKVKSLISTGDEAEDALSENYRRNAARMTEVLGQLKGASMKVGQMLSADPEGIPEEFAEGLALLQRSAPPMTWSTVSKQVEDALDRPIEAVFSRFDPDPIGAASIGQVHRARLDTGEEVAVKIQYPGVSDALESDLETLKSMLVWGRPFVEKEKLDRYFAEIREVLIQEADYEQEAQQLLRFRELVADRPDLRVPKAYPEHSRKTVLVMEYVEGQKLDDALEEMPPDQRDEYLFRFLAVYVWMFHELQEIHADPHPGNFLIDEEDRLVLLDFGCVKAFEAEFPDGMLDILAALWDGDTERILNIYARLGFGGENFDPSKIDLDALDAYHEIVLAPFLADGAFDFGGWSPTIQAKKFMLANPALLALTPPPDMLLYFRLLSGIKGLLTRFNARLDVVTLARQTAERRGITL